MKIGLRILFGYFLIVGLAAWFVLNVFVQEVKPGVRATMEDTLVDTAQMLAELVADDVRTGRVDKDSLIARMHNYAHRSVDAKISGVHKSTLDYRVYITDAAGKVIFDSEDRDVGKDYSRWNDVYLTLRGQYGARSTRNNPYDEDSTVMHVAAPILDQGNIIGVLTVAKANSTILPFIERSQQKILRSSAWLLGVSLLIGIGFSLWLSHSLRTLQRYATSVERGDKVALPDLGNNEIGSLGRALESMRDKLEGKQYVEELMHTLAHELKSPIAAIQGSAELLTEDMPAAERAHFLANIIEQNQRQKQLIDKLLALIKLEKQQTLSNATDITVSDLFAQVQSDFATRLQAKSIQLDIHSPNLSIHGDALLLRQALGNLLDNAIDFSPPNSRIELSAQADATHITLSVSDHGTGIPDYAMPHLFERFYSLARPNGNKSTGLGLPFVREVALLHGGSVRLENREDGGVRACLILSQD
jgi:two-component system, OmpR family, sensor histidine kinase CreC